jgi:hypothetical protein
MSLSTTPCGRKRTVDLRAALAMPMPIFILRLSRETAECGGFWGNGAPGRIRTSGPQIRSLVLYPAELRARASMAEGGRDIGTGGGARNPSPPSKSRVVAAAPGGE